MMALLLRLNCEGMVVQVELSENELIKLESKSDDLRDFISWLDKLERRPTLATLEKKLLDLSIDMDSLIDHAGYTNNGYQRNVLKKTENYELVLICWKAGQKTPIHDHKGSDCAFLILDGTSTETIYKMEDSDLKKVEIRKYNPGEVCAAEEPDIHMISNEENKNLINLHLYSPPLKGFNIYGNK